MITGRRSSLLIVILALLVPAASFGQSRVGTTSATFLTIGTGARGSALGHAYTAVVSGPDALFWNPGAAAIPHMGDYRGGAFFTHHNWFADIAYNAAGVTIPVTRAGVVGISLASVDYGRMDVRTVSQPDGTGETFTASDLTFGLTYAQALTNSFYFGGTFRYVRQGIRDMSASTGAVDFGFVLVTRYLNGARLAASIMNFGGKMKMDGINGEQPIDIDPTNEGSNESIPARIRMDTWDLPLQFKFGVAVPVIQMSNVELQLLADANQTNDNNLNGDLGAQLRYKTNSVTFEGRVGYKDAFLQQDLVDSHWSFGTGIEVRVAQVRFGFDYAYVPFDFLSDTQMVDFRVYF
jgi:hypothetical protein